jgi:hypothetical protein
MDPIRPELRRIMNSVGHILDETFKQFGNFGFTLMVYDFNKEEQGPPYGFMNYISNGRREDVVKALQEFITKLQEDKVHERTSDEKLDHNP